MSMWVAAPAMVAAALLLGLARGVRTAHAAETGELVVVAFADVTGGRDPSCPACSGSFDDADERYGLQVPLGSVQIIVRDGEGRGLASARTERLGALQTAMVQVPLPAPGEIFTMELVAPPAGWRLCDNDSPRRELDRAAIQAGLRVELRFYDGCERDAVTPTATVASPPTATSAATSAATRIAAATVTPARRSGSPSDGQTSAGPEAAPALAQERREAGAPQQVADSARVDDGALGSVRGMTFIDHDGDGQRDTEEPALNDVAVVLHGGGLQLRHITDGTGLWSFDGLGAGSYDLFIDPGAEWQITTPSRRTIGVAGRPVLGVDFGLRRHGAEHPASGALPQLPRTGATLPGAVLERAAMALAALGALGGALAGRRRILELGHDMP